MSKLINCEKCGNILSTEQCEVCLLEQINLALGEPDDHDCHLIGGGGESGCNHPSHDEEA